MNRVDNAHGHKNSSDLEQAQKHDAHYASSPEIGEVTSTGRRLGDLAVTIRARDGIPTPEELHLIHVLLSDICETPGRTVTDALVALSYGMQMLSPVLSDLPEHDGEPDDDPLITLRMAVDLLVKSQNILSALTGINPGSITGHFRPN